MRELEFYVDGKKVDMYDLSASPVKLNYLLLDLEFLGSRGATVSNVFKIPATKNNNSIFGFYSDIQSVNHENFIRNKPAQLLTGGISLLDGTVSGKAAYVRIHPESYEIMLKGDNALWADALAILPIIALDLPDPLYDEATVRDSWAHTYVDKYVAPLVCYGEPLNFHTVVFPMVWDFQDFRYWLFTKPLIEDMFAKAGFTIQSAFLDSDIFKRDIVYFNDTPPWETPGGASHIDFTKVISPDRNCLDLFKGVANRFNLLMYTDPLRKIVYIEPFDDFFTTLLDVTGKVDFSVLSKVSQFTDSLKNIFYSHSADAFGEGMLNYIKENKEGGNGGLYAKYYDLFVGAGLYTGGITLPDTLAKKEVKNYAKGFITVALGVEGSGGIGATRTIYMPAILDDVFTDVPHIIPVNPSREEGPFFAYYAGMCNMKYTKFRSATGAIFVYHGDAPRTDRPFAYMCDYANEELGYNFHYSDQWNSIEELINQGEGQPPDFVPHKIPGLIRKHYVNFLYSIIHARQVDVNLLIKSNDISSQIQRHKIQYLQSVWAMLEISNYNPTSLSSTVCKLMETKIADAAFLDTITYGGDYQIYDPITGHHTHPS